MDWFNVSSVAIVLMPFAAIVLAEWYTREDV